MPRVTPWILMAGVLLAGCTAPTDGSGPGDIVYTHQWAYGPGYGGTDRLPVFQDSFAVEGSENLTVAINWAIDAGRAAIVFTPPGAEAINLTDAATGGPRGSSETLIGGAVGEWGFRIPTWRDSDGAFPSGSVDVRVTR